MAGANATRVRSNPVGWRKWVYRCSAVILGPTVLFGLVELGLRLGGFGYDTSFFILNNEPRRRQTIYSENRDFARRFLAPGVRRTTFPIAMRVAKEHGSVRIFVLGESAAMGFPDPTCSFARVLEVMLRARFPDQTFEFVNTAFTAINSHAVLPIAREGAAHQPDFFIVLLGNNEVVGAFGAASAAGAHTPSLRSIRANLFVKQHRTGQLLGNLIDCLKPAGTVQKWNGMATFAKSQVGADDPRLAGTYSHFRQNLEDICHAGVGAGAGVIVCTVPVNLRDCPPFASMHAADLTTEEAAVWNSAYAQGGKLAAAGRVAEALEHYAQAAGIDDRFADLAFRRAQCLATLGRRDEARAQYERARDLDVLRFRSNTVINETVRAVAGELVSTQFATTRVCLVDAERDFANASPCGAPGAELFFEHVHLNFRGNYLLASSVFRVLAPMLQTPGSPEPEQLTEQQCADRLAYVGWMRLKSAKLVDAMLRDAPFTQQLDNAERVQRWESHMAELRRQVDAAQAQELSVFEEALKNLPDDWMIRANYAGFLARSGDIPRAIEQFGMVLQQVPHYDVVSVQLGNLLLQIGDTHSARLRFEGALRFQDDLADAHEGVAKVLIATGRSDEAIAYMEARLGGAPDRPEALAQLARMLLSAERPVAARARLREAFAIDPDHAAPHMVMGYLLLGDGHSVKALEHFDAALRGRPRLYAEVAQVRELLHQEPNHFNRQGP